MIYISQSLCDQDPSAEKLSRLEILKTVYDLLYQYITQGAILRSRARWYQEGEKMQQIFLKSRKFKREKRFNIFIFIGVKQIKLPHHKLYLRLN